MFIKKKITPLRTTYEELVRDPVGIVGKISSFVGVGDDVDQAISDSPHRKIADSKNVEWAKQFREEYSDFVSEWTIKRGKKSPRGRQS